MLNDKLVAQVVYEYRGMLGTDVSELCNLYGDENGNLYTVSARNFVEFLDFLEEALVAATTTGAVTFKMLDRDMDALKGVASYEKTEDGMLLETAHSDFSDTALRVQDAMYGIREMLLEIMD